MARGYRELAEFVRYALALIARERGLVPREYFVPSEWRGLPVLDCLHPELAEYLARTARNFKSYVAAQPATRLVFLIHAPAPTFAAVERWQFDVHSLGAGDSDAEPGDTDRAAIAALAALYRQIEATSGFRPRLGENHLYRALVYAQAGLPATADVIMGADASVAGDALPLRTIEHVGGYKMAVELSPS